MAVTLRDVARKAGVSAMSVSRVLNRQPGVSAELRSKVEAAVAELDYAPGKVAGRPSSPRTQLIGMIVPDVSNPFFAPVVRGAETTARRAGFRLLLCNTESDLRLERDYIEDLVVHRVEGLLIAPVGDRSAGHLARLLDQNFPLVLLDRKVDGLSCDSVTLNNVDAGFRLMSHLLAIGHRRIAFVADAEEVSTGRERLQGAKQALSAAGVAWNDDLVFHTSTDQTGGYRAAQLILGLPKPPTAIFAVNNMTALGVMQALKLADLRVPEDIALVCFDDVPHLAVIAPFLTVVDQPAETMAQVAMQLLLERISGNAGQHARIVNFPGQLIVRQSCGTGRAIAAAGAASSRPVAVSA